METVGHLAVFRHSLPRVCQFRGAGEIGAQPRLEKREGQVASVGLVVFPIGPVTHLRSVLIIGCHLSVQSS